MTAFGRDNCTVLGPRDRSRAPPARPGGALPNLSRTLRRRGHRLDGEQGRRRRPRAAHRCGGRRRGPRGRLVRRRPARRRLPLHPARVAGRDQRRHLGGRVDLGVRRCRAVARAGAGHRARPEGRGLRPRPAPRPVLARGPALRHDAGHPQRRRQPARAVPRRRGADDPADRAQRPPGRRRLRRVLVDPAGAGVPADPADRHRVAGVPATPRAALRPGPRERGRPLERPVGQPGRAHHHQGLHRRGPRAGPDRGRLPGLPPRQHRRHPLLGRVRARWCGWRSWPASPAPCCSAAG